MSDMYYDASGEFIGPKYWETEPYLDDDGDYMVSSMKRDESMYETYVFLLPAGNPEPAPVGYGSPSPNYW